MNHPRIKITFDRATGKVEIKGDKVFIRDPDVNVTLAGIGQEHIDAGLVFEIYERGMTLGSVSQGWTLDEEDNATGTLSTNTIPFVRLFAKCEPFCVKHVNIKAYTTEPQNPLFNGTMNVANFTSEDGPAPAPLLPPAAVIAALQAQIDELQAEIDASKTATAQAIATAVATAVEQVTAAFKSGDTAVTDAIAAAISSHNANTEAHPHLINGIVFCGTAIYIQCNEGALADGKWRKLIPAEPNELGEYMWMVEQSPTYLYNPETKTWEEEQP